MINTRFKNHPDKSISIERVGIYKTELGKNIYALVKKIAGDFEKNLSTIEVNTYSTNWYVPGLQYEENEPKFNDKLQTDDQKNAEYNANKMAKKVVNKIKK